MHTIFRNTTKLKGEASRNSVTILILQLSFIIFRFPALYKANVLHDSSCRARDVLMINITARKGELVHDTWPTKYIKLHLDVKLLPVTER